MCCVDRLNPQPFQDSPLDNLYTDSVLKRLLIICLVISTLGYGSVGAFDGHADEVNEHQGVVGYAGHSPDNDEDHPSCDHCCQPQPTQWRCRHFSQVRHTQAPVLAIRLITIPFPFFRLLHLIDLLETES